MTVLVTLPCLYLTYRLYDIGIAQNPSVLQINMENILKLYLLILYRILNIRLASITCLPNLVMLRKITVRK